MSTYIRLFQFLRQHCALSKTALNKLNFENDCRQFFNYQAKCFVLQFKNYSSIPNEQININKESDIDQKIVILNKESVEYGTIIKFNIDDVLHNVRKSGTMSNLEGLFLLRCCSELIFNKPSKLRQKLGNEIWETLKESGVQLEVSHYNALLAIYLETDYQFSPFDILWNMANAQIEPNQETYTKLISYFCNSGRVKEATQILKYMEDKQLTVTEDILSSFIFAHCIKDDMNSVMKILDNMKLLNVTVTSQTHSAFMYAFARKGDLESIKNSLAECKSCNIEIPEKVFLNIIYELCVNGFSEKVDEILSLLPHERISVREGHNLIYKLIEKKNEDSAFKILEYLSTNIMGEYETSSNFFIQLLITFNTPVEKSIDYCLSMKQSGINSLAFVSAINKSIENHMYELSFSFMKAWKELGGLLKENYFYPIFKNYGKSCKYGDINTLLQKMIVEFEVNPSIYMIKTYILPYMPGEPEEVLSTLINNQVSRGKAVNAIMLQLLTDNKIRETVKFMSKYHSFDYNLEMFKYNILTAFRNTEDISSVIWMLHYFYINVLYNRIDIETYQQFVDSFVLEIVYYLEARNKYMISMFFSNMINKGLSISLETVEKIEEKLGDEMTPEILKVLNTFKSAKLVPKPIFAQYGDHWPKMLMNIEKFENIIKQISETNSKIEVQINNDVLIYYSSIKDEKKVCDLIEEFNKNNIIMTNEAMDSVIDMFVNLHKVPETEFWLDKMKEKIPNFRIKPRIALKLAKLHVNNGDTKRALEYLAWPKYSKQQYLHLCSEILKAVLKYDDENLLHQFFETLSAHGYVTELRNELFAPFIQLHLNRNDGEAALAKFEWVYNNYKLVPLAMQLMKKMISDGNRQQLQKIQDICKSVYGKRNTYFDVALAYLENNKTNEAMDIIKNHCSNVYENRVKYHLENKYAEGEVEQLEKLFEIFNDLHYDVDTLCVLLLKSYSAKNKWEKCYELWMKMQKKNINPSSTFIDCLNLIMINKNMDINESLKEFSSALKEEDYTKATELLRRVPLIYKSDCCSMLCKKYLWKNQFSKTIELWQNINANYNIDINIMTAELMLSKMLQQRDLESIQKIEEFITPKFKKQLDYNYYLNQAYLKSGSWNTYLKNLEIKLNEGKISSNNLNLHFKTVVDSLIEFPEMCSNFESLAYKFAENNILEPITALWVYYFLQKNPAAEEIWTEYLQSSALFLWMEAINFSQNKADPDLYVKLSEYVNRSSIETNIKLVFHNRLIKKCLRLNDPKKYEYAVKCLQNGMANFSMNQFSISLLVELQKGLEASGIAWPWSVNQSKTDKQTDFQHQDIGLSK